MASSSPFGQAAPTRQPLRPLPPSMYLLTSVQPFRLILSAASCEQQNHPARPTRRAFQWRIRATTVTVRFFVDCLRAHWRIVVVSNVWLTPHQPGSASYENLVLLAESICLAGRNQVRARVCHIERGQATRTRASQMSPINVGPAGIHPSLSRVNLLETGLSATTNGASQLKCFRAPIGEIE